MRGPTCLSEKLPKQREGCGCGHPVLLLHESSYTLVGRRCWGVAGQQAQWLHPRISAPAHLLSRIIALSNLGVSDRIDSSPSGCLAEIFLYESNPNWMLRVTSDNHGDLQPDSNCEFPAGTQFGSTTGAQFGSEPQHRGGGASALPWCHFPIRDSLGERYFFFPRWPFGRDTSSNLPLKFAL